MGLRERADNWIALVVLAMIATSLVVMTPTPAEAGPSTATCAKAYDSYSCLERFGYGASTGSWADDRYPAPETNGHNCTRFAGYFLDVYMGVDDPRTFGVAWNWGFTNAQGGLDTRRSMVEWGATRHTTARVGDIAWWNRSEGRPSGHVGVVVAVNGDTITVASDSHLGTAAKSYTDITAMPMSAPTGFLRTPDTNGGWPGTSASVAEGVSNDFNRDGTPDIWAFNKRDGGSNSTAVHIIDGKNPGKRLRSSGTWLHQTDSNWDLE